MGMILTIAIIVVAVIALGGLVWFLLTIGVIVQKAGEPAHLDQGTYTMEQGREIKAEDQQERR